MQASSRQGASAAERVATQDEIERTGAAANLVDGAGAVLVDGVLVGIADEYGTAVYVDEEHATPDAVENVIEAAFGLLADGGALPAAAEGEHRG